MEGQWAAPVPFKVKGKEHTQEVSLLVCDECSRFLQSGGEAMTQEAYREEEAFQAAIQASLREPQEAHRDEEAELMAAIEASMQSVSIHSPKSGADSSGLLRAVESSTAQSSSDPAFLSDLTAQSSSDPEFLSDLMAAIEASLRETQEAHDEGAELQAATEESARLMDEVEESAWEDNPPED